MYKFLRVQKNQRVQSFQKSRITLDIGLSQKYRIFHKRIISLREFIVYESSEYALSM